MLKRPIPTEAMPVVEVLRRDVPRPDALPTPRLIVAGSAATLLRWGGDNCPEQCPMGLHPLARVATPSNQHHFPPCNDSEITAFYHWFDCETDPEAVMDAIWPPLALVLPGNARP